MKTADGSTFPAGGSSSLGVKEVAWARLAAGIAKGGAELLRKRFAAARGAGIPPRWVEELLLQSFLNVGYPLTLAAFGVWRETVPELADAGGEPLDHAKHNEWKQRGVGAAEEVYGRTYQKLLSNLRALHPAVEHLVVTDAYGKILSREGVDAKWRELATLSAIALLDAPNQLHAHLRGALNLGWSREEIDALLALLEHDMTSEHALEVWSKWAEVRERGL
ncbi:MAG TPA: carboxymuconolactone decarboxylase family protein [Gemmatimonadales bacterium]|nr:carboxymuconolactone decarboxylase family protein [Gemmatimonadales bacterium]